MNHEFKFDSSSFKWEKEESCEYNLMVAKHVSRMLMDLLWARGYLYLNQVYEHFGLGWNPDNENVLIRYHECYTKEHPLFYFDKGDDENCVHILIDAYHDEGAD